MFNIFKNNNKQKENNNFNDKNQKQNINKTQSTYQNLSSFIIPTIKNETISAIKKEIIEKANEVIKKEILTSKQSSQYNEVIKFLQVDEKMYDAFKIFKYLITNTKYDQNAFTEKRKDIENHLTFDEIVIKDIYRCLCKNKTICTGYACSMVYLLEKIGIKASHETISPPSKDKNKYHEVVVFENQGKTYISDPTLIRILIDKAEIKKPTINNFCYEKDYYFNKIRPNWIVVAQYRNINIESDDINNLTNYEVVK